VYLDLAIALEYLDTPEAMTFIFKILDIKNLGYLDHSTIMFFIRDVTIRMLAAGMEDIGRSDFLNEVFDIVCPRSPDYITLKDLLRCNMGGVVLNMLVDFTGFHLYDTRPQGDGSHPS
jgi:hypothetical protein